MDTTAHLTDARADAVHALAALLVEEATDVARANTPMNKLEVSPEGGHS